MITISCSSICGQTLNNVALAILVPSIISFFVTSIPLFSIKKSMILNIGFPPKNFIKSEFSILLIMSTKT